MNTLEKAARAVCGANCFRQSIRGEPCLNADGSNGPCQANKTQLALGGPLDTARAVLKTIREPDDATIEEMHKRWRSGPDHSIRDMLRSVMKVGIDHILTQGETE